MLGARIAQRRQVHPRKERLTSAEQDRRDRDVHFVDEARLEILAHRGRPAADLDIAPARGLPGATERFLNSAGDEMIDGPAFHRDWLARVFRQHKHRRMIGRILPPPAAQLLTTHAEWVLQSLAGAGAVPVERDREVVDAHFGHGILRWFHMRRMGRPEVDRRRMSWGPDSATPGPYFKTMRGQRGD